MQDFQRMNNEDFIFTIRPKPGSKKVTNSMIDPRLLDQKNKLHAVQDGATCLWSLKYEHGSLPEAFKGKQFTRFQTLHDTVVNYFNSRGYDAILNAKEEDVKSSNA